MRKTSLVLLTAFGECLCENCRQEILADEETGDMPDYCKKCGSKLDYSLFDAPVGTANDQRGRT